MKALHFGGGNIGRGFIGEVLFKNGFETTFSDINDGIIDALNSRKKYEIEYADASKKRMEISGVSGINSAKNPRELLQAILLSDIITTAIGPGILPAIARTIAEGIDLRMQENVQTPLDIIACENMIGGSSFLKTEVLKHTSPECRDYLEKFIGFPDAAVDRIIPIQAHDDPLFVSVEPFCEWVLSTKDLKNKALRLDGVLYVDKLEPYIERKLFTVNTGHASVAYLGFVRDYKTIDKAMSDEEIISALKSVLAETSAVLIDKWGFEASDHQKYVAKVIGRFKNPYISDDIARVARTPIRKLGFNERFIRPIRGLAERGLDYGALATVVANALRFYNPSDEESVKLAAMLEKMPVSDVISEITSLEDESIIANISAKY